MFLRLGIGTSVLSETRPTAIVNTQAGCGGLTDRPLGRLPVQRTGNEYADGPNVLDVPE